MPRSRGIFELVKDAVCRAFEKVGAGEPVNMESWRLSFLEVQAMFGHDHMLSVKTVISFWVSRTRQSCSCKRSLKATMDQLKNKRKDVTVQWFNDALLLRRHGPQKREDIENVIVKGGSKCWDPISWTLKAQQLWRSFFGQRLGVQQKVRSDKGVARHAYGGANMCRGRS